MTYLDLLNIRYKVQGKIMLLMIFFLGLFLYVMNIKISDVYNTFGYIEESMLNINVPLDYSDTLNKMEFIKIDDKRSDLEILNISEILIDKENLISYQIISFDGSKYKENQLVKVTIYYNKEKVWQKLKKIIL